MPKNNSIKAMVDGDASVAKRVATSTASFDPEGDGYDYATAIKHGMKVGLNGHWGSREPRTGQLLKGRKHKTWDLLEQGEKEAGYEIYKGKDGKYYSKKKKKKK